MIKKEADGCYLVREYNADADEKEAFALRMMTENEIAFLLRPQLRSFNGEKKLYYEISGKQSLAALAKVKVLSGEQVRSLLGCLYSLLKEMPGYFLDPEGLLLDADLIFTDGTGFCFLYAFSKQQDAESSIAAFAAQLLGSIDHTDEEAVVFGYQFYKAAGEGGGSLPMYLERVFAAEPAASMDRGGIGDGNFFEEASREETAEDDAFAKETEDTAPKKGKRPDPFLFAVSLLLSLLGAALLIWRGIHIAPLTVALLLSGREGIGGLLFLALGLLSGLFLFRAVKRTENP